MFEILEHTADIGFRAKASSLPELFETAAEALVAIAMDARGIEPQNTYQLAASGDTFESLLVNWLNEVLYYLDGEHLAIRTFHVKKLSPNHVKAEARGEVRDASRHCAKVVVKGVTYHQLKIEETAGGWECEVYLDI